MYNRTEVNKTKAKSSIGVRLVGLVIVILVMLPVALSVGDSFGEVAQAWETASTVGSQ